MCNHIIMKSDDDLLQQLHPFQQKPTGSFKSHKPLALLVFVLFIVLMAGTGGYFLGRSTRQSTSPARLSQPLPNTTITREPATTMQLFPEPPPEITHWKTFQNLAVGYTIQYPEGVEIKNLSERDILVTRVGVPYGGQEGKVELGGMSLYYRGGEGLEQGNDLPGMQSEGITVNRYPAVRVLHQPDTPYIDDIFIADSNNRRVLRVAINTAGDAGFEESTYKLFHQILSTLRFME
jgi:hypothetical protein